MSNRDVCKNCGAGEGLHQYETNQCPVNGREAPFGRPQEWASTTFERVNPVRDAAPEMLAALEAVLFRLEGTYSTVRDQDVIMQARAALKKAKGD